jgi:hypothetical protein
MISLAAGDRGSLVRFHSFSWRSPRRLTDGEQGRTWARQPMPPPTT